MSLRRLVFAAAVVIAIGVIHRRRREKAREVSSGSKPIEAVGTQTVG
jgi:hypothetical protein